MNTQEKFSLVQLLLTFILTISVALGGWSLKTSVDNGTRLTKLESQIDVEQQKQIAHLLHTIDKRLLLIETYIQQKQKHENDN
jgi:hypothetical protein